MGGSLLYEGENMYARNFVYNGTSLSSLDSNYLVAAFESDAEDEFNMVSRSVGRSDIRYDQPLTYDYGAIDEDVLTFDVNIIKNSDDPITRSEMRQLVSWLMSPVVPQWANFTGCNDDYFNDLYFKGRFVSARSRNIGESRKIAATFTFENIAPYAFTEEYTYILTTSNGEAATTIENYGTYVGKTVLPQITIHANSTGNVTIRNSADSSQDAFSIYLLTGQEVTVRDHNCFNGSALFPFENLNNYNWPIIKDGNNPILVTGDATVTIKTRFYEAIGI